MKDDQELTPLESLFQEQLPVLESGPAPAGLREAIEEAELETLDGPREESDAKSLAAAADAEMIALVQSAAPGESPGQEAQPESETASEGREATAEQQSDASQQACGTGEVNDVAEEKPYEELVRELEQIVRRLESGDITLDQSMALFARGIELTRVCQNQLDAIEKKIMILIEGPDGSLQEKPFPESGHE